MPTMSLSVRSYWVWSKVYSIKHVICSDQSWPLWQEPRSKIRYFYSWDTIMALVTLNMTSKSADLIVS